VVTRCTGTPITGGKEKKNKDMSGKNKLEGEKDSKIALMVKEQIKKKCRPQGSCGEKDCNRLRLEGRGKKEGKKRVFPRKKKGSRPSLRCTLKKGALRKVLIPEKAGGRGGGKKKYHCLRGVLREIPGNTAETKNGGCRVRGRGKLQP